MHKDWKGPGWYDVWNDSGFYWGRRRTDSGNIMNERYSYEKLINYKPPARKFDDGVYLVQTYSLNPSQWIMRDGNWYLANGERSDTGPMKILGRIPVEPID